LRDPTLSRFGTIPACDRQTDRQTDKRTYDEMTASTALALRRAGKTILLWKRTVRLINLLLYANYYFRYFWLILLYSILRHFIPFSAAVQYCRRHYTNAFCDCVGLLEHCNQS